MDYSSQLSSIALSVDKIQSSLSNSLEWWQVIASVVLGLTSVGVTIFWASRENRLRKEELAGAISISVSPDKVIKVRNTGRSPVELTGIYISWSEENRTNASVDLLFEMLRRLKSVRSTNRTGKIVLGSLEEIVSFPERDIDQPIEMKDIVVILIRVKYRTLEQKRLKKDVGVYWMTPNWYYEQTGHGQDDRYWHLTNTPGNGLYEANWHIFSVE